MTSKSPYFLLNKNKNETESKMANPTHNFREKKLVPQLNKNLELKVELWWVGAHER